MNKGKLDNWDQMSERITIILTMGDDAISGDDGDKYVFLTQLERIVETLLAEVNEEREKVVARLSEDELEIDSVKILDGAWEP